MTGTAMTEAGEFWKIYKLDVVDIPTNRPLIRVEQDDVIYRTEKEKYAAIVDEIVHVHASSRPILVGTTSIEKSELISGMLDRRGVEHEVLNAKQHEREAIIVATAGQPGRVTIATNMAGRGTDILLGPGREGRRGAAHRRHRATRVPADRQPAPRARRPPGRPGLQPVLPQPRGRPDADLRAGVGVELPAARSAWRSGEAIAHPMVTRAIAKAQKKVESAQLRDPQEPPRVRRGDGQPAQGGLRPARQMLLEEDDEHQRQVLEDFIRNVVDLHVEETLGPRFRRTSAIRRRWPPGSPGSSRSRRTPADVDPQEIDATKDYLTELVFARWREREQEVGAEDMRMIERYLLLDSIDSRWKDHLHAMDGLKTGIGLRAYGQIDPKVAFKIDGHRMFGEMLSGIRHEVTEKMLKVRLTTQAEALLQDHWSGAEAAGARGLRHRRLRVPVRTPPVRGGRRRSPPRADGPRGADPAHGGQGRPQRCLSLRLRQEVQEVLWAPGLTRRRLAPRASGPCPTCWVRRWGPCRGASATGASTPSTPP